MARRFEIDCTITKQYRQYNAIGAQLTARLLAPADKSDPVGQFLASLKDLFEYALQDMSDSGMVRIKIQNPVNRLGFSLRNKYQLFGEAVWSVL